MFSVIALIFVDVVSPKICLFPTPPYQHWMMWDGDDAADQRFSVVYENLRSEGTMTCQLQMH